MASTVDESRGKNNHVILNCFVLYGVCFVGVYLRTSTTASEVTDRRRYSVWYDSSRIVFIISINSNRATK